MAAASEKAICTRFQAGNSQGLSQSRGSDQSDADLRHVSILMQSGDSNEIVARQEVNVFAAHVDLHPPAARDA